MPRIPDLEQSVRMNVSSPVPIASSESASLMGDALSTFGKGVAAAGQDVAEIAMAKNKVSKNLAVAEGRNYMVQKAMEHQDEVLRSGAPDGSDFVQKFNDAYDKTLSDYTSKIQDGTVRKGVTNEANEVRNVVLKGLYDKSRKLFTLDTQRRAESVLDSHARTVYQIPESLKIEEPKWEQTIRASSLAFAPGDAEKALIAGKKHLAETALAGYANQGRFSEARNALMTDYGDRFTSDERIKLMKNLNEQEATYSNRQYQQQQRFDKEQEKLHQQTQEKYANTFYDLISEKPNMQESQKLLNVADQALAAGALKKEDYNLITKQLLGSTSQFHHDDEMQQLRLLNRLANGENPDQVRGDALKMAESGDLSPDNAQSIVNSARNMKKALDRKATDPSFRRLIAQGRNIFNAQFGKEGFDLDFHSDKAKMKAQAMSEWTRMINAGKDPINSANYLVKKYLKGINSAPFVPGVDATLQSTPDGLNRAGQQLKLQFDQKRISPQEYKTRLKTLIERQNALKRDQIKIEEEKAP